MTESAALHACSCANAGAHVRAPRRTHRLRGPVAACVTRRSRATQPPGSQPRGRQRRRTLGAGRSIVPSGLSVSVPPTRECGVRFRPISTQARVRRGEKKRGSAFEAPLSAPDAHAHPRTCVRRFAWRGAPSPLPQEHCGQPLRRWMDGATSSSPPDCQVESGGDGRVMNTSRSGVGRSLHNTGTFDELNTHLKLLQTQPCTSSAVANPDTSDHRQQRFRHATNLSDFHCILSCRPRRASASTQRASTHAMPQNNQTLAFLAAGSAAWPYAESCTPETERPDGSSFPAHDASHSAAVGVEQATDGPPGTVSSAERCGKCCSKIVREAVRRRLELLVAHNVLHVLLDAVNPVVADAVRELLLLAPQHVVRQVRPLGRVKCLAHDPLLDAAILFVDHLLLGVNVHRELEEPLVQEGHAALDAPRHGRLVGAQAVVLVQRKQLTARLGVELLRVGRLVEVEVATKDLVCAFARQNHLHPERLDLSRHEEHGRRCTNRRRVKRLNVVDHIGDGVDALLHGERELVVVGVEEGSNLAGGREVRAAFEADAERVQTPPHLLVLRLGYDARRDRRDERRVEAA
eukprot:350389-Chlamydomonas_euryale.AAC.4